MQEFLHNLWRSTGLSVLLITHDIDEALLLAQQVHVLAPRPGRIVESLSLDLDMSDLRDLRISASFQTLRHQVADTLRQLDRDPP
jgi:NitT/TauT family transport system ATP-binding protein